MKPCVHLTSTVLLLHFLLLCGSETLKYDANRPRGLSSWGKQVRAISLPTSEYDALQDLFSATNGAEWRWREVGDKWQFNTYVDPCTSNWQGIECTVVSTPEPATYHISSLALSSYNLQGFLPPSLSNLSKSMFFSFSRFIPQAKITYHFTFFNSQAEHS